MNSSLFVKKRNGQKELFDIQKIKTTASWSTNNIDGVDPLELERHIHLSLKDGMLTTKIMNEMIQSALSLVSLEEPNWSLVAGRLALMDLNKSVRYNVANFKNKNVKKKFGYSKFSDYLNWAIESNVYKDIKSSYTQDQIDQIDNFMDKISQEERDLNYHYCTIASMQTQYLQKKESKLVELPQEMYMAISMTLAPHVSKTDDEKLQNVFDFFKVMSEQYVSPGTPTVRNIRTEGGSGMSCAVDAFGDSLDQIDHTIEKVQKESTKGTGWGAYIGKLRAKGSWIQKHKDMAGGTVPFLKQLDSAIIAVDQLGAREANIAVYQDCWHLDILDFLELKTENGDINRKAYNLFLAVCFNDEFFRRRDAKEEWTLIDPYEARQILGKDLCDFFGEEWTAAYSKLESSDLQLFKKINAMDLWKAFIKAFSETGDPFTFNRDGVNRLNPNPDYPIYGSNLCVTGDTRLHTQFGMVCAKDLYNMGDEITATVDNRTDGDWLGFGVRKEKCFKMHKTAENADIFEVTTNLGMKIKATAWHEFFVRQKDKSIVKLKLKDLKEGDLLMTQSAEGQWGNQGSYEEGLVIGMVAGDGTYYKKHGDGSEMCLDIYDVDLDTEVEWTLTDALNKIRSLYKLKGIQNFGKYNINPSAKRGKIFYSKRINASAVGLKMKDKYDFYGATKLKVPDAVFRGKKDFVVGYLRGLFTADGTVNTTRSNWVNVVITQKSKGILEDVQILLSNFGIRSQLTPLSRNEDFAGFKYINKNGDEKTYKSKDLWRLTITLYEAKKFMDEIGFLNKHKTIRFENEWNKFITQCEGKLNIGDNNPNRKYGMHTAVVKSITYVGKEDVYDTTQHNNNSLIFNGLVTGNCSEITSPFIEDGVSVVTSENMEGQIFEVVKRAVGYTATCNLASINMSKLSKEDPKLTEFVARIAIKLIDAVITENNVASLSAKRFNKDFRSAGIGYIGVHNFLALNKLKYGSKEAIDLLDSMLNKITYFVISESCSLAKNFGPYPKFRTSKMAQGIFFGRNYQENGWDEEFYQNIKAYGLRNGYMFAIAPNTSTSLLINETPSIYPVTDKLVLKEGKSGSYLVPMPNLDSNFAYYIPAHAMDYKSYLDTVAIFQKWTDQSISAQIYFDPNNPEHDALYLHNMFKYALNDLHLKTTYYSRQKPSSCFGCAN